MKKKRETHQIEKDSVLYWFIVSSVVINAIPLKSANAIVTLGIVLAFAFIFPASLLTKRFAICLALASLNLLHIVFLDGRYAVSYPSFLWGLLTHAPWFFLLAQSPTRRLDRQLLGRINRFLTGYVAVQFVIGLMQFSLTRNPDTVCGTFGLLDFRSGNITISQVWFTFNLLGICFFFLSQKALPTYGFIACFLIILLVVIGHSAHQFAFVVLTLPILLFRYLNNPRIIIPSIVGMVVVALMIAALFPETITVSKGWYRRIVQSENSPKRFAIENTLAWNARERSTIALGMGFGQYTTRAGFIGAGTLNPEKRLPYFLSGRSTFLTSYDIPAVEMIERGEGSAMAKPFFSLINLYAELGLAGVGFLIGIMVLHIYRDVLAKNPFLPFHLSLLFFLTLCSVIENYFEFTQALVIPFLLFCLTASQRTKKGQSATSHRLSNANER